VDCDPLSRDAALVFVSGNRELSGHLAETFWDVMDGLHRLHVRFEENYWEIPRNLLIRPRLTYTEVHPLLGSIAHAATQENPDESLVAIDNGIGVIELDWLFKILVDLSPSFLLWLAEVFIERQESVFRDLTRFKLGDKVCELLKVWRLEDFWFKMGKHFRIGCDTIRLWRFRFFNDFTFLGNRQTLLVIRLLPFLEVSLGLEPDHIALLVNFVDDEVRVAVLKRAWDGDWFLGLVRAINVCQVHAYAYISLAEGWDGNRIWFDHFNNYNMITSKERDITFWITVCVTVRAEVS
jgi:hypothetical protein